MADMLMLMFTPRRCHYYADAARSAVCRRRCYLPLFTRQLLPCAHCYYALRAATE